jgi:hypothetical protein
LIAATLWVVTDRSHQQIAGLEGRVNQLEQANESLKRQADESDRLREKLARLERGEHPQPGPTEALKDGNYQVRLDPKGELLGLAALPESYHALVKDALESGAVVMPPVPTTGMGRVGTLLGAAPQKENFELIFPIGTTVEDTRPKFNWQTLPGAGGYTIFVRDTPSGEEIEGQLGAQTGWQPERQLARGSRCGGSLGDKPGPQELGRFSPGDGLALCQGGTPERGGKGIQESGGCKSRFSNGAKAIKQCGGKTRVATIRRRRR